MLFFCQAAFFGSLAAFGSSAEPFSINMTVNGDPATRMGFAWFTDTGITDGCVQIVSKPQASESDFSRPDFIFPAISCEVKGLNYSVEKNRLKGVEPNQKIDYTSHKAIAAGLSPATTYSYRVGTYGAWSSVGSFTTASGDDNERYSFIYITDTQAQNDEMFDVSQMTVHAAIAQFPESIFVLCNGDLVESSGALNSEWEYQQWFSTMQDVWMNYPLAVTMGNHDVSSNKNFEYHFNNSTAFNDNFTPRTDLDGTVFSFVRGDVLFLVMNFEDCGKAGYLDALSDWMRQEVKAHEDVKWRVASFHKTMFTGSRAHQDDSDSKRVRRAMLPVFSELEIDVALQGHDHVYEVIGPVSNADNILAEGSVEEVVTVGEGGERENMTGKEGGVFDVSNGTLYFLNNSAGTKKYEPRTEAEMDTSFDRHEVENYWGLFSGKFGQTGEPTFSHVEVSPEAMTFSTYTVDGLGSTTLYDRFTVVKGPHSGITEASATEKVNITYRDGTVTVEGISPDIIEIYDLDGRRVAYGSNTSQIEVGSPSKGIYIVRATESGMTYTGKIFIDR